MSDVKGRTNQAKKRGRVNPAPIRYAGSKATLMVELLKLVPKHTRYVSVFGGSGADILNKPASAYETWNDLDGDLHNLFTVLKDDEAHSELVWLIDRTCYSPREYADALGVLRDPAASPVRRARATVVAGNQSRVGPHFSQGRQSNWASFIKPDHKLLWPRVPRVLLDVARRLRSVVVENLPWDKLLDRYDAPSTLFYLDPPYVRSTRSPGQDLYLHEMTDADHRRLLDRLRAVEGRVILSGYDSPLYAEALGEWPRHEIGTVCRISSGGRKPPRKEIVWCNYTLKKEDAK